MDLGHYELVSGAIIATFLKEDILHKFIVQHRFY
jgi:hypothetical protein